MRSQCFSLLRFSQDCNFQALVSGVHVLQALLRWLMSVGLDPVSIQMTVDYSTTVGLLYCRVLIMKEKA